MGIFIIFLKTSFTSLDTAKTKCRKIEPKEVITIPNIFLTEKNYTEKDENLRRYSSYKTQTIKIKK